MDLLETSQDAANDSPSKAEWRDLLRSIRVFSGANLWVTIAIVAAASLMEGLGLVMLLPIATLLFAGDQNTQGLTARLLDFLGQAGMDSVLSQLIALCSAFLVWMAVRGAFLIYRDRRVALLSSAYVDNLRVQMFTSIAHGSWPVVRRFRKSDLINALTTDIARIKVAIQFLCKLLITASLAASYMVVAFVVNPLVGLVVVALTLLAVLVALGLSMRSFSLGRQVTGGNKKQMFATTNFLDGLKSAKIYGAEEVFIKDFSNVVASQRDLQVTFVVQQGKLRRAVEMAGAVALVALLVGGYGLLGLSAAELLALGVVVARIGPSLLLSLTGFQSLAFAMPAFTTTQRRRRWIEQQSGGQSTAPKQGIAKDLNVPAELTLSHVAVSVEDETGVKRDILQVDNLRLPATGLVALTGASGAGKSTFAELLAGLYLPERGEVQTAGVNLTEQSRSVWQSRVSFAPQEPFLFNGTVRDNLTWPNLEVADDKIWEALAIVGAEDLVRSLPGQLAQGIQDGGSRLSGGERQRLCLARALLRPSALLIIDEATSAVEAGLERHILEQIKKLSGRQLVLFASHSSNVDAMADHIVSISPEGSASLV